MHTTVQILDAIAEKHAGATDYRLSKLLGTSTSAVANWRKGRSTLSPEYAHKAAAMLDWDPAYVIACMEHERLTRITEQLEATDEIRATWERIAQRFKPAAAILAAVFLMAMLAPSKVYASERAVVSTDALYIMRSTRRRTRKMLRAICDAVREAFRPYGTEIFT